MKNIGATPPPVTSSPFAPKRTASENPAEKPPVKSMVPATVDEMSTGKASALQRGWARANDQKGAALLGSGPTTTAAALQRAEAKAGGPAPAKGQTRGPTAGAPLSQGPSGTKGVQTAKATQSIESSTSRYLEAQAAARKKSERVGAILGRSERALSDPQKSAIVAEFRKDEVFKKEQKAADDLKASLESPENAQSPAELKKGYLALARSGHAMAALEWAHAQAKASPTRPIDPELEEIAATAAETVAPGIMAESDSASAGLAKLEKLLKPFVDNAKDGSAVSDALDTAKKAASGNYTPLKHLTKEWNESSRLAKALGVISIVAGAKSARDNIQTGEYISAVKELAESGADGLAMVAGASKALANSAKGGRLVGLAAKNLATISARLLPAVGAIASGASFADRVKTAREGQSTGETVGNVVGMVGDLVSIAGSTIESIPGPGGMVGVAINASGTLVGLLGDGVSGYFARDANIREEQALFTQANLRLAPEERLGPKTIEYLSEHQWTGTYGLPYGLSAKDLQTLIENGKLEEAMKQYNSILAEGYEPESEGYNEHALVPLGWAKLITSVDDLTAAGKELKARYGKELGIEGR